jgi:predicted transcriptional regulator YdeE
MGDIKKNNGVLVGRCLGALPFAAMLALGGIVNEGVVHEKAFVVIGIAVRTDNRREATPEGLIPKQWQRFFADNLQAKISGRQSDAIYALYTQYQSDKSGDYTYILGKQVRDGSPVPPGMVSWTVPGGDYKVFTTARGNVTKVVPSTWRRIWDEEDHAILHRAYRTDFEVYDERARDPQNSVVDIYIGVK